MEPVSLALRLALAVVFAVAGVAKLAGRADFRRALGEFGAPAVLVAPVAVALPVAELGVAVALVLPVVAWWAAIAAVALLLAFSAVVGTSLARGRAPQCNCFGRLSTGSVGRDTLIRNAVLVVAGGLVIAAGPARARSSAIGWLAALSPVQQVGLAAAVAGSALLAFHSWVLVHVVRQNGRLLDRVTVLEHMLRLHEPHRTELPLLSPHGANGHRYDHHHDHDAPAGPQVGDRAPDVALVDLDGNPVNLADRWADGPTAILFWSPTCGFCQRMLPDLRVWEAERLAASPRLLVVSSGSAGDNRAMGLTSPVLLDDRFAAGRAFGVTGTPQAVLVDADGTVAAPPAAGSQGVLKLMTSSLSAA
jgi:thiol-disulfide isomerase/thioredoxin